MEDNNFDLVTQTVMQFNAFALKLVTAMMKIYQKKPSVVEYLARERTDLIQAMENETLRFIPINQFLKKLNVDNDYKYKTSSGEEINIAQELCGLMVDREELADIEMLPEEEQAVAQGALLSRSLFGEDGSIKPIPSEKLSFDSLKNLLDFAEEKLMKECPKLALRRNFGIFTNDHKSLMASCICMMATMAVSFKSLHGDEEMESQITNLAMTVMGGMKKKQKEKEVVE